MSKIMFHLNCLEQGGAERVVSNLANQFVKEKYEVIVATEWQGKDEFWLDDKVRRIHVGLQEADEKKGRLAKVLRRQGNLRRLVKEEKPDILIAFAHNAIYRALLSTIGLKTPVLISVRTDPAGHYDSTLDKLAIPVLFRRAAGCVFQTEGQKAFFPGFLQRKSRIILNPVHEKYFQDFGIGANEEEQESKGEEAASAAADAEAAASAEQAESAETAVDTAPAENTEEAGEEQPREEDGRRKAVVQSGRLVDFKNQPMLIEAFLKVREAHPDYVLEIYGPDSFDGTKETLETLITRYQAGEFIRLMGGSDRLEKLLPDASVFAFSSDWEGLPNALLEAMAMGLPIVATDCPCGGPRTVITNEENGLLVPIKDAEAMAAGINRLIEDRELAARLGENARSIRELVNPEAVITQWRSYIDELIAPKPEPPKKVREPEDDDEEDDEDEE